MEELNNISIEEHQRVIEDAEKWVNEIPLALHKLTKCKEELKQLMEVAEELANQNGELRKFSEKLQSEVTELQQQLNDFIQQAQQTPNQVVEVPKSFWQKAMSISAKAVDLTLFGLTIGNSAFRFASGDYVGGTVIGAPMLLNMMGFRRLGMLLGLGGNLGISMYPAQAQMINQYTQARVQGITESINQINTSNVSDIWKTLGFESEPFKWIPTPTPAPPTPTPIGEQLPIIANLVHPTSGGIDINNASLSLTDDVINIINKNFEQFGITDREQLLRQAGALVGFKDDTGYSQQILSKAIENFKNNPGEAINQAIQQTRPPSTSAGWGSFIGVSGLFLIILNGLTGPGGGSGILNPLAVTPGFNGNALGYAPGFN